MVIRGDRDGIEAEPAQHQTFSGLKGYAARRGYKPGWASMKFKELFGRWPNGESREPAAPAGHELLGWIRRQNIAYAKSKGPRKIEPFPARLRRNPSLMSEDDWNGL